MMDIVEVDRAGGGQLHAVEDGQVIGMIRWRADGSVWVYDGLSVADGHQRQGVGTALAAAANERRTAAGAGWAHTFATAAGQGWIDRYLDSDVDRPATSKGTTDG